MKRADGLFARIVAFDNLLAAERLAARGKRDRGSVARFEFHLERELIQLQEELMEGRYRPGTFYSFEVRDPKPRAICAAPFRDRVVHHAVCDVLEPVFERYAIFDSYACRIGKGTHAAIARAQAFARRDAFFLKCDVRRFFASVDHEVLKAQLARHFCEPRLLELLGQIIVHGPPDAPPGKGLPIGNLTSQHFANRYLGELDHFVKERLRVKAYLRYMDDLLLFAPDKPSLHLLLAEIRQFLAERLHLELKDAATLVAPVSEGIPFLGFRIYPRTIRLNQRTRRRFRRQVRTLEAAASQGRIDESELANRAACLFAHVSQADAYRLRRRVSDASITRG
ncbi:RNA-directed DNA polymerase [Marichromatium purpuratum 984]|uniref:RNA-directed DNA polymerase n=1 Tax=Marichromatium purpuratum 984 TaxID=765910 RepID=W0E535_MARPU|nr:RNA-directed DNA polymerase [Marichromatium purpuratum]AHF04319.1 RNA-directed DNA polymerase [Marichromatium purpuratum 984]